MLTCTQAEHRKRVVHGSALLAMEILTTTANMFPHQWQMIFQSAEMKPATHALHTIGPGGVPASTVHSENCQRLPLCHTYFALEMRMEIANMSFNKMQKGSWSVVMN
jgi:hypothetical protein